MSIGHRSAGIHRREWRRLRRAIFERDGYRCVLCGRFGSLECDHIVAVEDGGTNDPDNLRTVCRDCHIGVTRAAAGHREVHGQREWAAALNRRRPPWR